MPRGSLESVDAVRASIGVEAGVGEWLTITQERINAFADLSEDWQWIHVDVERAQRESPFHTTIAHGFLTVALLTKLVQEAVDIRIPCKLLINYGFNKVRFPSPVPAGSKIRAHVTPNAVSEVAGGLEIAWGIVVEIEGQGKPAVAAEWLLRLYF